MAWTDILRLADRLAPSLRKEFLAAVQQLRARLNLESLAAAVASGRLDAVEFELAAFPRDLRPAVRVVNRAFTAGGHQAAHQLGGRLSQVLRFDVTNPAAVVAAERNAAALVSGVSKATRTAIREVIARAVGEGIPPREAAQMIKPLIGLRRDQAAAVMSYRKELQRAARLNAARLQRAVERYSDRLLRQRALLIARTETLRAVNEGQQALWEQAVRDGLLGAKVMKLWIVTPDDKTCPSCKAVRPKRVPLRSLFRSGLKTVPTPPLHPNCRCTVGISTA
jgi:hypothetical protein